MKKLVILHFQYLDESDNKNFNFYIKNFKKYIKVLNKIITLKPIPIFAANIESK